MSGPHWLADTFAALLLGTAAYCVGRLVMARMRPRAVEHDVDMVHVVMGIAMAGMLVPAIDPVGNRSWEVVFVAAMAWFTWRAFREVLVHRATRSGRRPSPGACGDVWRHGLHAGRSRCGVVPRVGARPGPGRYGWRRRIRAPPGFTASGRGPGGVPPRVRRVVRRPLDARCRRWAAARCPACLGRGRNGLFLRPDSQFAARSSCASRWATCSSRCSDGGAGHRASGGRHGGFWGAPRLFIFVTKLASEKDCDWSQSRSEASFFVFFNTRGSNGRQTGP